MTADPIRVVRVEDCPGDELFGKCDAGWFAKEFVAFDASATANDLHNVRGSVRCGICDGQGWVPVGDVIEVDRDAVRVFIKALENRLGADDDH